MKEQEFFVRYPVLLRDADVKKLLKMHDRVGWIKQNFPSDVVLRRVLMNRGYGFDDSEDAYPEDTDPEVLENISGGCFNRKKVLIHLDMIQSTMNNIKKKVIVLDGTYPKLEDMKDEWYANQDLREMVSEYREKLLASLNEYDRQLCLIMWQKAVSCFITDEEYKIHHVLKDEFSGTEYSVLDNAYYSAGNSNFNLCGDTWHKLKGDGWGRYFILEEEEVMNVIRGKSI